MRCQNAVSRDRSALLQIAFRAAVTIPRTAYIMKHAMNTIKSRQARALRICSGKPAHFYLHSLPRTTALEHQLTDTINSPSTAPYCAEYIYNDRSTTGVWYGYSCGLEQATLFAWPETDVLVQSQSSTSTSSTSKSTTISRSTTRSRTTSTARSSHTTSSPGTFASQTTETMRSISTSTLTSFNHIHYLELEQHK